METFHGLGMISRNSESEFLKFSTGVLPTASPVENKLNTIHHMVKAFGDNCIEVVVEIDNLEAFMIIKNISVGVPEEVAILACSYEFYNLL